MKKNVSDKLNIKVEFLLGLGFISLMLAGGYSIETKATGFGRIPNIVKSKISGSIGSIKTVKNVGGKDFPGSKGVPLTESHQKNLILSKQLKDQIGRQVDTIKLKPLATRNYSKLDLQYDNSEVNKVVSENRLISEQIRVLKMDGLEPKTDMLTKYHENKRILANLVSVKDDSRFHMTIPEDAPRVVKNLYQSYKEDIDSLENNIISSMSYGEYFVSIHDKIIDKSPESDVTALIGEATDIKSKLVDIKMSEIPNLHLKINEFKSINKKVKEKVLNGQNWIKSKDDRNMAFLISEINNLESKIQKDTLSANDIVELGIVSENQMSRYNKFKEDIEANSKTSDNLKRELARLERNTVRELISYEPTKKYTDDKIPFQEDLYLNKNSIYSLTKKLESLEKIEKEYINSSSPLSKVQNEKLKNIAVKKDELSSEISNLKRTVLLSTEDLLSSHGNKFLGELGEIGTPIKSTRREMLELRNKYINSEVKKESVALTLEHINRNGIQISSEEKLTYRNEYIKNRVKQDVRETQANILKLIGQDEMEISSIHEVIRTLENKGSLSKEEIEIISNKKSEIKRIEDNIKELRDRYKDLKSNQNILHRMRQLDNSDLEIITWSPEKKLDDVLLPEAGEEYTTFKQRWIMRRYFKELESSEDSSKDLFVNYPKQPTLFKDSELKELSMNVERKQVNTINILSDEITADNISKSKEDLRNIFIKNVSNISVQASKIESLLKENPELYGILVVAKKERINGETGENIVIIKPKHFLGDGVTSSERLYNNLAKSPIVYDEQGGMRMSGGLLSTSLKDFVFVPIVKDRFSTKYKYESTISLSELPNIKESSSEMVLHGIGKSQIGNIGDYKRS